MPKSTSSLNTTSDPSAVNPPAPAPVAAVTPVDTGVSLNHSQDVPVGESNFVYYSQRDAKYKSPQDGATLMQLDKYGCGTTVTAMLLTNYSEYDMDPLETRNTLFTHENYKFNGFYFSDAVLQLEGYGFDFEDASVYSGQSEVIAQATYENPIVVGFKYKGAEYGHYVLAVGQDADGNPLVYDPFHEKESGPTEPIALTPENYPGLDLSTADITIVHPPKEAPEEGSL
jgi:hypothetical protein